MNERLNNLKKISKFEELEKEEYDSDEDYSEK